MKFYTLEKTETETRLTIKGSATEVADFLEQLPNAQVEATIIIEQDRSLC